MMDQDQLDRLETLFLNELLDVEGKVPTSKLDQMRRVLERNHRIYAKVKPRDIKADLDQLTVDPEDGTNHCILPFRKQR